MPERDYLLFQLYGPLASWGDIAVGEYRPSYERPSKSAILGLLAAALGIKRPNTVESEPERANLEAHHAALAQGYGMSVECWALADGVVLGGLLRDFHTVQRPPAALVKKSKRPIITRRDELAFPSCELATTLSSRDYRTDAYYRVALWAKEDAPIPLKKLAEKLAAPDFVLYLGRKSCPLALPLDAHLVNKTAGWNDAFDHADFKPLDSLGITFAKRKDGTPIRIRYGETSEGDHLLQVSRRDQPLSRTRWQFDTRTEYQRVL